MLTSLRYPRIPSRLKGGHVQHLARTRARRRDKGPTLRIPERLVGTNRNLPNRDLGIGRAACGSPADV